MDIFFISLALFFFFCGLSKHVKLWKIGAEEKRMGDLWPRIKTFLIDGIAHRRILQDRYHGYLHLFLFIGFAVPATVIVITQFVFTTPLIFAKILSLTLDLIAFAAVVALILIIYRRYVTRPERLDTRTEDTTTLVLILFILITGITLEGLRLSVMGNEGQALAPLGKSLASLIDIFHMETGTKSFLAEILFRIHFFLVLFTIATIPYSKLFHIISSPMNMITRSLDPKGSLSLIDFEDEKAESFGVTQIEEFTWKQLMDLDACTRCGRCQDHCPAYLTDKPLSPKKIIQDLKDHLYKRAPLIIEAQTKGGPPDEEAPLIGKTVKEDELWACTTCRSCMEHCPVYIEHVDKIVDMRRYQTMMESKFPEELITAFKGLETNSNPWGIGFDSRADWAEQLDVPVLADLEDKNIDLLFYVGCIRSYDDRNKKISFSMAKILNHLGIKFAILGKEEGCCGDPARRVGNEYLFQTIAQKNIETFKRYNIKNILTTCPHCYNTLNIEYAQLGFDIKVVHHAEFLMDFIQTGRLKPDNTIAKKLTYHDPCYLGRYSDIYDPPRKVLESISSQKIREMKRSRKDSFCCGAGGGWMWMDEKLGKRINIQRLDDALTTDAEEIATACPFCVTMFTDAVKDKELSEKIKVWDLAELVEQTCVPTPEIIAKQ